MHKIPAALQHVAVFEAIDYSHLQLSPVSFLLAVDQSMFENSIAQQQSPQTSRTGQFSARRTPVSAASNAGSASIDSPSSGGQQRLKNAINLGKVVGAKVSATEVDMEN